MVVTLVEVTSVVAMPPALLVVALVLVGAPPALEEELGAPPLDGDVEVDAPDPSPLELEASP